MTDSLRDRAAEQLNLIGFNDASRSRLGEIRPVIDAALAASLDNFYDKVGGLSKLSGKFSGTSAMEGAKSRQTEHWRVLSSGNFTDDYYQRLQKLGEVHVKVGLEPDWYLVGYGIIVEGLVGHLISDFMASHAQTRRGRKNMPDIEPLMHDVGVMIKLAMLDAGLAVTSYLDVLARERAEQAKAEQQRRQDEMDGLLKNSFGAFGKALAEGDLSYRMGDEVPEKYREMSNTLNQAMDTILAAVQEVRTRSRTVGSRTAEISRSINDLSERTAQQAASLEESSAALNQLGQSVNETANASRTASGLVSQVQTSSEQSAGVVDSATKAMEEIANSSGEIEQIVTLINEIAFQTNLLSLNASVEAARAGEAGRGFAVVAQEVRALAQRCADAAGTIKSLVTATQSQVQMGVDLVGQTKVALTSVRDQTTELAGLVANIAHAATEQATGVNEVGSAVTEMDRITQENAGMVDKTNASTQGLNSDMDKVLEALTKFRTEAVAAGAVPMPVARAV